MIRDPIVSLPYPNNLVEKIMNCSYLYVIPNGTLEIALKTLPERHRKLVQMRFKEHMSFEDIGKTENITGQRVKQLVDKSIVRLKRYLTPRISVKPPEETENLVSKENLMDKEAWRYGGIERNFTATAKYFRQYGSHEYDNCSCCGKEFTDDDPIYMGAFKTGLDTCRFRVICRDCAYELADHVAEADGKNHKIKKTSSV